MLTTNYVPGAPNFINLATTDFDKSVQFYGEVFGWTYQPLPEGDEGYGYLCLDGKVVAGISPVPTPETPSTWTVFFHSQDAAVTSKAIAEAGGTIVVEPFEGKTTARWSFSLDVGGSAFAVWEPIDRAGAELVGVPGSLGRVELHAPDRVAAVKFYESVFGWQGEERTYAQGRYTMLSSSDGEAIGGIASLLLGQQAHWLPYIEVDSPDDALAAVNKNGGFAITPVVDVPDIGRMGWLSDPSGARFAVVRSLGR
ncbi:VOC family protein [Kibdelosporangium aridum]|uniref:VOC family protein n=1 Tax=Kibdelosporangium aridum TaxID=2030 RepID=UPI0005246652